MIMPELKILTQNIQNTPLQNDPLPSIFKKYDIILLQEVRKGEKYHHLNPDKQLITNKASNPRTGILITKKIKILKKNIIDVLCPASKAKHKTDIIIEVTPKIYYWIINIYNPTGEKKRSQVFLQNAISNALQDYRRTFRKQYPNAHLYIIFAGGFNNVVDMQEMGSRIQNAPDTRHQKNTKLIEGTHRQ